MFLKIDEIVQCMKQETLITQGGDLTNLLLLMNESGLRKSDRVVISQTYLF